MTSAVLGIELGMIGNVIPIVAIVFNVLFVALTVLGILLGFKRGLFKSIIRLGAVLLSIGLSLAGSFALRNAVAQLFDRLIASLMENESTAEFANLVNQSETLTEFIESLPVAIAGPFVFLSLFIVINIITYFVFKLLAKIPTFTKHEPAKKLGKMRVGGLFGAVVSTVASLLIVCCFFIPFSGYVALADDVVAEVQALEDLDEEMVETIDEIDTVIIEPLNNSFSFKATNAVLGAPVFNPITSFRIDGEKVVIQKEVAYIAETYTTLRPLIEVNFDFTQFGQPQADALRQFAADFNHSTLIPRIIADIIPMAATAWNDNEAFLGIPNPLGSVPESLQPLVGNVLTILETTTYETLQGDLVTVTDLLATMAESGTFALFGEDLNARDLVLSLSEQGLISGLINTLYENERMQVLVADIANIGFAAIGESLSIPADDEEVRANLTAALFEEIRKTETVEGHENKVSSLSKDLETIFTQYGVEVGDDEIALYAECIVSIGPISGGDASETVEEYFSIISDSLNKAVVASLNDGSVVYLSSGTFINENLERAINNYLAQHADAADAIKLADGVAGNTEIAHSVITLEQVLISAQELFSVSEEEFKKQTAALEEVLVVIGGALDVNEEGAINFDFQKVDTEALSSALHDLSDTRFDESGNELQNFSGAVTNLVKSSLQTVGIDAGAANNLVDHMLESKPAEGETGKDTLSTAFSVVGLIGKESTGDEDVMAAIETLVTNLDPEAAKVLSDCISPSLIKKFAPKLDDKRVDSLVTVIRDLLKNFGEHADELSAEQLEAETTYLQTILELGMNAGDMKASDFFTKDETGEAKLGKTAEEFIDCITHSVVITHTIVDHAEDLKIALNDNLSESDKAVLLDAINKNVELNDELRAALVVIFSLEAENN